jgi:hypothetical protein
MNGGVVCNAYDNRKAHINSMTSILTYPVRCTFLLTFKTPREIYFSDHKIDWKLSKDMC